MADHYVAEIRSIRPDGPYLVHGYCGGAFIAYEIAQQLQRGGATVSGLIVVDPPLDWRRSPFLVTSGRRLPLLMAAARVRLLWARARSFFRERNSDGYRRVLVARTLWNALANYIPEPYQGPALVLYCSEQRGILLNRKRGLHHLMPCARFVECGSTHGSLFERSSRVLAETKSFIERVEPANAGGPPTCAEAATWP
jgi:hypothetical protein